MNILKYTDFLPDRPSVFQIKITDRIQQIAIALGKGAVLAKHKTSIPATLIVLKGSIRFVLPDRELTLNSLDFFEIPLEEVHHVEGLDAENLFLITKEVI